MINRDRVHACPMQEDASKTLPFSSILSCNSEGENKEKDDSIEAPENLTISVNVNKCGIYQMITSILKLSNECDTHT